MINDKIDEMIASALKNRETDLLNVLKLIKTEFVNAMHNKVELNEANEVKILLKMASQREDSIQQYIKGRRKNLTSSSHIPLNRQQMRKLLNIQAAS